jgi:hypothetical protein
MDIEGAFGDSGSVERKTADAFNAISEEANKNAKTNSQRSEGMGRSIYILIDIKGRI